MDDLVVWTEALGNVGELTGSVDLLADANTPGFRSTQSISTRTLLTSRHYLAGCNVDGVLP